MFKNKVIIITGSTQGIGLRTAEMLAERGAFIIINSRSREKVVATTKRFEEKGWKVLGVHGDVSDYEFCKKMCALVIEKFARIDYLINNAGLAAKGNLSNVNPIVYRMLYEVNVLGSLYPTMVFLEEIKKTKGGVLFISSLAGIIGLPSYSAYSATKRSIVSLAESFKTELIDDSVFVGVNYPGFTENDVNKQTIGASGKSETMQKRNDVKVEPLDKTVKSIIRQLECRKFRSYSSFQGRFVQVMYRIFPVISLYVLKMNRHKIMNMQ